MKFDAGLVLCSALLSATAALCAPAQAEPASSSGVADAKPATEQPSESPRFLYDDRQTTPGSVIIGGKPLAYQAEAGVMVIHLKDPMDDDPPPPREEPEIDVEKGWDFMHQPPGSGQKIPGPLNVEMRQLPIEASLQNNIEMHFYTSGHMVYAHEPDLKALHANVAAFIEKTRGGMAETSP